MAFISVVLNEKSLIAFTITKMLEILMVAAQNIGFKSHPNAL